LPAENANRQSTRNRLRETVDPVPGELIESRVDWSLVQPSTVPLPRVRMEPVGSKYSCRALIELEQTTEALVTFDGTSRRSPAPCAPPRPRLPRQPLVLHGQIFILQQQLLVHRTRSVRQQSHPPLARHTECLSYSADEVVSVS
jgi:hypothetical protein